MMMDLPDKQISSLSLVATVSGVILSLSTMFFVMSFAAAIGLWTFRFSEIPQLGMGFWLIASAAWILSSSVGSLAAVLISRPDSKLDAYLQALVSWGGAYLIFGGLTVTIVESISEPFFSLGGNGLLRAGFLGDAGSLVGALLSGRLGLQIQKALRANREEKPESHLRVRRIRFLPSWKAIRAPSV